ncbi:rhodanese-like domain-containing protein [Ascoidea rubescens DSM 1968]|uniref:Rhodanese-like protein n=1 Tax=Ascoidea rubescens DSM 1968 TaxID=1344418 RepID=A0A1D2VD24_9ASCO|nr:Rhodanese-like protein [Ascoidea rubescens DSM 1968]ODV59536.1 Rhodanese-like protein [Ascoidea rubescens DSM 1968]
MANCKMVMSKIPIGKGIQRVFVQPIICFRGISFLNQSRVNNIHIGYNGYNRYVRINGHSRHSNLRFYSNNPEETPGENSCISKTYEAKNYKFEDIKKVIEGMDESASSAVLIDVREPEEYNSGHIPKSINLPLKTTPGALDLDEEKFEEIFGFEKPGIDRELIFYCHAGVRSTTAEELAGTFGYKKRGNYIGSFQDWVEKKGEIEN